MDEEVRLELEKVNTKLNNLDTKLDKNTLEGNRLTLAIIGFSVAMVGIAGWIQAGKIQIETWSSPSNSLVFYGALITVLASLSNKKGFKKWIKIAFWVLLAVLIAGSVTIAIAILLF